jgi:magnesium transporter
VITILVHDDSGLRRLDGLTEAPALIASGARVWIDVEGTDPGVGEFLADTLKIHPLAVEDILQDRPTPKAEDYGDYLYVVAHGIVAGTGGTPELETLEIDLVFNAQWLFTHHLGPSPALQAVKEGLARNPRPIERGPAAVAHAILDHLVDNYLPVVDELDDQIDAIEHDVVEDPSKEVLRRIFRLKRSLQRLRRIALHQREVLQRLSRGEFELIPERALPFYRDVYDHFARVADLADSYRELLSGALEAYLSTVSNRMNEVMKTLTIVATIMLPLTFIVGVYGMNFSDIPELKWHYGYLYVWALMVAVVIGMLYLFRRKRWM